MYYVGTFILFMAHDTFSYQPPPPSLYSLCSPTSSVSSPIFMSTSTSIFCSPPSSKILHTYSIIINLQIHHHLHVYTYVFILFIYIFILTSISIFILHRNLHLQINIKTSTFIFLGSPSPLFSCVSSC
uniref:Uncharacterized protein n=1 Tax=Cacopsylla melanoneura TaxID=428564 RepID=A0A8D9BYP2_9HEMI